MANTSVFYLHGVKSVEVGALEGKPGGNLGRVTLLVTTDEGSKFDLCFFGSEQAGLSMRLPAGSMTVDPGGRPTYLEQLEAQKAAMMGRKVGE